MTYILATLNLIIMALAFTRFVRTAAIALMVIQIPWTIWDLHNHYYGFLLLSAVSIGIGVQALRKG
jgi:hypothetical protein